jgi:RNA polymerase sigma factor FliA
MKRSLHGRGLVLIVREACAEAALWRRFRFEAEANCRALLFERYAPLARKAARREWRRRPAYGLELRDFEHFAISGLLEAIDRFDPLRGAPFDAFARNRMRGAIADGANASSEAAAQYSFRRRIETERLRSLADNRDEEDPIGALAEIAAGLAIGLVVEDGAKLLEQVPSPELSAYETHAWRDMQRDLLAALDALDEPSRTILHQHYLHAVEFAQLAKLLGLSRGRVSQLHRTALMALRQRLRYKE